MDKWSSGAGNYIAQLALTDGVHEVKFEYFEGFGDAVALLDWDFATNLVDTTAYIYDANGNLTSDGEFCYFYNDANKVSRVENCINDTLVAEYIYDAAGQRTIKKVYNNGTFVKLVIDIGDIYDFTVYANTTEEENVYYRANNELIAKKDKNGTVTYHHNDHLGSASIVTTGTGALLEETRYYPYGEVRSGGDEQDTGKYQYTGQENDFETGLNYYGARYYNPGIGRFVQPDSMLPDMYDPQQLNRYVYVKNNPIKFTDPTGNYSSDPGDYPFLYTYIKDPNIRKQMIINWISIERSLDLQDGLEIAENIAKGVSEVLGCTAVDVCDFYELATKRSVWGDQLSNDELGNTAAVAMVLFGNSAMLRRGDELSDGVETAIKRGAKVLNPKMYRSVAKRIAYGHALPKHLNEFRTIKTGSALANLTEYVMKNPNAYSTLKDNREIWFNKQYNTIVIFNPNDKHRGTVFKGTYERFKEIVAKDQK